MKKSTFIFVFLMFIFGHQVSAQNNTLDNLGLSSSTPASVAYSLRKLSSNYSGPLVRILIGTSYYDVYPDTTNDHFFSLASPISASYSSYNDIKTGATATLLGSLVTGSTSARVAIWYDQSGNGIDVITASSSGPIIIEYGAIQTMNGKPSVYFANVIRSTVHLTSSSTVDFTSQTAATLNVVAKNVGSVDYISGIISTGTNGGWGLNYDPSNGIGYWIDGSGCANVNSGDTSNISKIVTGIIDLNNSTSSIYENGSLKQTNNSICQIFHTSSDNICIGIRGADGGGRVFDGYISEVMIFPSYFSSTNRSDLESNQNVTYFSPSVSIVSSDTNNSICLGDSVTFTASSYNVNSPTYQWYLNGSAINGETTSVFTSTTLANNDTIYVVMDASGTPITSNSISTSVSNSSFSLVSTSIKLSTGASTVTSLTSNLTWAIDNTLNDNNALFQITSGNVLSFINPVNYGQNNTYLVSAISGSCNRNNITVTISPYCGNWNKGGDGLTQANPGTSAYQIKSDHPNSQDGVYWINLPNVGPTQIYCVMNSAFDGGGWMLAMKATTGTTFNFDANYWTTNNTLNPTDTNRNNGDAKFETMNNFEAKDMMAIWPDISNIGSESGSIDNLSNWTWLQNNFHGNGSRTSLINKFLGSQVDYYSSTNGSMTFSGYGSVFSNQGGYSFYGINYSNRPNARVRWGFAWNNETDQNSNDVSGGIGMDNVYENYSAGDRINCCFINIGINRSARVELYIR